MNTGVPHGEHDFRILFDSHPVPMWVYDLDTLAFLEVNDAAVAGYGYSRDEFLRMTIRDIRPPDEVTALTQSVAVPDALQRSGPWTHRTKSGALLEVEITSHSLRFSDRNARLVMAQDVTERSRSEAVIKAQQAAIQELSTPVLELKPKLLLLPLIGVIDSARARLMTEQVLLAIASKRARVVIVDVTGVPAMDSAVANHLILSVRAARLMGASALVCGLTADNAQTLARLGIDLHTLNTVGSLADGVEVAIRILEERQQPGLL